MKVAKRRKNKIAILQLIAEYIKENAKAYLILLLIFFIGLIIGVLAINNSNDNQSIQISDYINNFINSIKDNNKISTRDLFISSAFNNTCIAVILCLLGSTVIGIPLIYLVIGYKGYCIGYTISSVIATIGIEKGILFIASTMFLQNIIYIPAIITLAVSGIKLYKLIMKDRRKENIKVQVLKHMLFSLVILIVLLISSLVETYVSGNLSQLVLKYV